MTNSNSANDKELLTSKDSLEAYMSDTSEVVYVDEEEYTDEDYLEEFSYHKESIKNPVWRFLYGKKYLSLCFFVPIMLMAPAKEPASFFTVNISTELAWEFETAFTLESTTKRVVFSPLLFTLASSTFSP